MTARHDTWSLASIAMPLDVVRAGVLRLVGRLGRTFLADRSARVALYATFGLVVSLALACLAPVWAFALGPIVLGVPHLVSDVRYLVVRPGLHRRVPLVVTVGLPLVVATIVQSPAIGLASGVGAIVFATGDRLRDVLSARRLALLAAVGAVTILAAMAPRTSALVLLHGHNAIAVVVFLVAFARSRRVGAVVALSTVAATIALLSGALDPILGAGLRLEGPRSALSLGGMLDVLAPNVADPRLAVRLAILFVFAQGFHYVIWLRIVPEEARERPGIRSFASSVGALERELGVLVVGATLLLALALVVRAAGSLEAARALYLRASGFHGYLEIAFLLYWLSARRAPSAKATPSCS